MLLEDLFINMTILISFISLGSQLIKRYKFEEMRSKITIGLISGGLGILLMIFSVKVNNSTIIDFRNIATIMAAIFGGTIPVLISCIMIATFRVAYFGVNMASLLGVVVCIINSIGCWYISKQKMGSWKKWAHATLLVLVVSSVALSILLGNRNDFITIMFIYWLSYCFVSAITYWYVSYSLSANSIFRRLQKESTKDFLTDLNNVRQFDNVLNNATKIAREKDENLSLLMVDIDFFKRVNDVYG